MAVDLHFTDGSTLRSSGAVDQNGCSVHPSTGHCGKAPQGVWSNITTRIGERLAGKKIDVLLVAYDQPALVGQFRAYVDDIEIAEGTAATRAGSSSVGTTQGSGGGAGGSAAGKGGAAGAASSGSSGSSGSVTGASNTGGAKKTSSAGG